LDEACTETEPVGRVKRGKAGGGAGAAGAAIDRPFAVEDGVAPVGTFAFGLVGPEDMTDAADAGLERMYRLVNGLNHLPDGAAQLDDASRAQGVEAFVRALRLDDRIQVAAIGDVERQRSEAGNLDLDAAPGAVGRHGHDADATHPVPPEETPE